MDWCGSLVSSTDAKRPLESRSSSPAATTETGFCRFKAVPKIALPPPKAAANERDDIQLNFRLWNGFRANLWEGHGWSTRLCLASSNSNSGDVVDSFAE